VILKITSVVSYWRRIQARCKDLVKVTEKFIRRGIHFQQTKRVVSRVRTMGSGGEKENFLFSTQEIGAKPQNGSPLTPSFILES
jgi:hypothetical protein